MVITFSIYMTSASRSSVVSAAARDRALGRVGRAGWWARGRLAARRGPARAGSTHHFVCTRRRPSARVSASRRPPWPSCRVGGWRRSTRRRRRSGPITRNGVLALPESGSSTALDLWYSNRRGGVVGETVDADIDDSLLARDNVPRDWVLCLRARRSIRRRGSCDADLNRLAYVGCVWHRPQHGRGWRQTPPPLSPLRRRCAAAAPPTRRRHAVSWPLRRGTGGAGAEPPREISRFYAYFSRFRADPARPTAALRLSPPAPRRGAPRAAPCDEFDTTRP